MKKTLFVALALIALLSSCKKDKDSYYIRCTIDGTARTFNVGMFAKNYADNGFKSIGTGGFATSDEEGDWLGFWIDNIPSGNEIVAGAYDHTSADFDLLATFSNESVPFDYASGTSVNDDAVTYGVTITNHFKLTILSIDGNTIKGTFSGDFYDEGDPRNSKKSVMNGEFYLELK